MLGVGLMLLAAFCNASASVLQRKASKKEATDAQFSLRMFWDLVHRKVWVFGILTMITGFLLHAVSISISQIAMVQPLLVAELPFTLVLAAITFHLPVSKRDWTAIAMASVGLGAFVGNLAPHGGSAYKVDPLTWAIAIAATLLGVGTLVVLGYRGKDEHRAAFLGVATGGIFGLNSSLIAGVGASVSHGGSIFLTWQTYGVGIIAPTSFFLLQNALAAGNLVASQPGFTLTNPLVSVAYGLVVFNEQTRQGIFVYAAVAGAVLIGAGTILLSQSKLLQPDGDHHEEGAEDSGDSGEDSGGGGPGQDAPEGSGDSADSGQRSPEHSGPQGGPDAGGQSAAESSA
ncbi:MAG TPA: DMT family transporter [Segeticoccus sp.]|uniref:DMT family transporter n=1 Tax=Segeticoccus sp. TaxID=2706531 RepID=UPI002D8023B5|nr:DMT family transporter [Segeticoccus sp.]HET8600784.1 DMT family transporter [Segeticoccus sp.]